MVGSRMVEPLWGDPAKILTELLVNVLEQEVGESDNEEDEDEKVTDDAIATAEIQH